MKLTITTMLAALATVLFTTAACAREPAPAPDTATDQAKQVQELRRENAAIREELSALRTEIDKQPQGMMTSALAEESQDKAEPKAKGYIPEYLRQKPQRAGKTAGKLDVELCTYVTHEELFRIEKLDITGDLKAGDPEGRQQTPRGRAITQSK